MHTKVNSVDPDQTAQICGLDPDLYWLPMQLTLSSIYMHFYACATSVDPDQLAHLIWICTGRILDRNNLLNLKVNRIAPGCAG